MREDKAARPLRKDEVVILSREEKKKLKQVEEARKEGYAPAEKDETGRDINPHIPQFISEVPWYAGNERPTLRHQKREESLKAPLNVWYESGVNRSAPRATSFRKGACDNCGASTHKSKECTDRPRAKKARFSNTNIAPDEILPDMSLQLGFEGKRDTYSKYDVSAYQLVVEEYERVSDAKRQQVQATAEEEDEDKIKEFQEIIVESKDAKTRTTTRDLRIREDTAKYLLNLDTESAWYDPKSRSMRENPYGHVSESDQPLYQGDIQLNASGDAGVLDRAEMFAWEAYKAGSTFHPQAVPTQFSKIQERYGAEKSKLLQKKREDILSKYGGQGHLGVPADMTLAATEEMSFYTIEGKIVPRDASKKLHARSKFPEDVLEANHTCVWGSWYDRAQGRWGFACCRSLERQSFCQRI